MFASTTRQVAAHDAEMEDVMDAVRSRGGVVHSTVLVEAGITRYRLRAAVSAGFLLSPRRGWIALPDADPYLVAAARAGVVLTCVTQAKRLGLWVLAEGAPHVAAPPSASRLKLQNDKATVHWSVPVHPRPFGALEDGILNTLTAVASCQAFEAALAVWNSALNLGLVRKPELERLPMRPAARRVLEAVTPFADSGLETIFATRLRWLRLPLRTQIWIGGHRVDFLLGERLVV